ncbi:MAG: hypothetical protein Q9159_006834 [Coniocarpon cinnabarinum]
MHSLQNPLALLLVPFLLVSLPSTHSYALSTHPQLPLFNPSASAASPSPALSGSSLSALLALHKSLISIRSITGHEQNITTFLSTYLESRNFSVELQPVEPEPGLDAPRHNIYAYPRGCTRDVDIVLTSHVDTVPPFIPYRRTQSDNDETPVNDADLDDLIQRDGNALRNVTIHGRGSADDYASLSAQIFALQSLLQTQRIPQCSTGLLFVVSEETLGTGMKTANALNPHSNSGSKPWRAVVFGEPTDGKLAAGHKGVMGFTLRARGQGGHSGYPWLGVNANDLLLRALGSLKDVEDRGGLPFSEKFGNTTVNVGAMRGGVAGNVIAEEAEALVTMRVAGGTVEDVRTAVEKAVEDGVADMVAKAREEGKRADVRVEWGNLAYSPVATDTDVTIRDDDDEEEFTVNFGTDVPNLKGRHRRYLYGPGTILVAHGDHERVSVGELMDGVRGYERVVLQLVEKLDREDEKEMEMLGEEL